MQSKIEVFLPQEKLVIDDLDESNIMDLLDDFAQPGGIMKFALDTGTTIHVQKMHIAMIRVIPRSDHD